MKNIFAEIEHISGSIVCSFIMFDFIVCQVGYKNIVKVSSRPLLLPRIKFKTKNKKRSGTSLPDSFSARFLKKNIFYIILFQTKPFFLDDQKVKTKV